MTDAHHHDTNRRICCVSILVLMFAPLVAAQNQDSVTTEQKSTAASRWTNQLFNYLNMSETKASEFRPLTQPERTKIYLKRW